MAKHQIDDGYTSEPTSIKGWKDHLPFDFQYRCALPEAVADYRLNKGRAGNGKAVVAAMINFLKPLVTAWTKEDDNGQPLAITKETLRRTAMPQLEEMVEYVGGYGEADTDAKN